jgi:di- and tripeptidase
MEVPGSKSGTTTIARKAKASLSIRIVPDQQADEVAANLTAFAQEQFDLLDSQNELTVEITGKSDAWLGDPDNEIFATLSEAITAAWTPDQQTSKHQYPVPKLTPGRATPTPKPTGPASQLLRKDSSDSLASHVDRVITSTTTSSGKAAARKRSTQGTAPVPTSNTLSKSASTPSIDSSSLPIRAKADSETESDSPSPSPSTTKQETQATSPSSAATTVKPIFIREGGSIPTIRFLEKEFSAPAANLPCGQASDNAHLDNERMRVENLYKSREIFRYVFAHLVDKI